MARNHGAQIKDDKLYEDLRKQGSSKEKAARIANAKAGGTLKHDSTRMEDRTVAELRKEATRIGIAGRSTMNKAALVSAIRDHKWRAVLQRCVVLSRRHDQPRRRYCARSRLGRGRTRHRRRH